MLEMLLTHLRTYYVISEIMLVSHTGKVGITSQYLRAEQLLIQTGRLLTRSCGKRRSASAKEGAGCHDARMPHQKSLAASMRSAFLLHTGARTDQVA